MKVKIVFLSLLLGLSSLSLAQTTEISISNSSDNTNVTNVSNDNISKEESLLLNETNKKRKNYFYFKMAGPTNVRYFFDKKEYVLIEVQEECKQILPLEKSLNKPMNVKRAGNFVQRLKINENELQPGVDESLELESTVRGRKNIRIERLQCTDENYCKGENLPLC